MRHDSLAQPHFRRQQFLKLLETAYEQPVANRRPAWLARLLDCLCDCIEPIRGEARVGYDLISAEEMWQIDLFLGQTEIVGGSLDGLTDYVSFTADIPAILELFTKVDRCEWLALPNAIDARVNRTESGLFIEGLWEDQAVRVVLRSTPPKSVAPGMRQYPDGRYEVA